MDVKDINLEDYRVFPQADGTFLLKRMNDCPRWEELGMVNGKYIDINSCIRPATNARAINDNKNVFLTEKHAKSALAMAQISQLMPYYGGEITDEEWSDGDMKKYVIMRDSSEVKCVVCYLNYDFLAFHTKDQRDEFLKNNEQLVKDYLMIE